MALGLTDKKYVKVTKGGVTYNVINVRAVKNGVTYNVWGSGSSVTYVVDTNVAYSEDVLNGDSVLSPKTFTPTKSGYTFVGWRTDKTASASVLTSLTMDTDPITLYAVFKRTLTLTYYDGTTTKKTTTGKQYYNNDNTLNPSFVMPQTAKDGWSTRGWAYNTGAEADISYKDGATISIGSDTTIYGCYQQTITLSYNGNGASSGSTSAQTGTRYWNSAGNYSNPTFELSANGFAKSGYSFVQWRSGSASGTAYAAGASVILSASTTFYAEWFDVEITVFSATFNENHSNLVFEEASRNMDSNYLSSVMSLLRTGADQDETNYVDGTVLSLTSKAKSEYNYVTVTFRELHYCVYGDVSATVAGETLYSFYDTGGGINSYTKKYAITNTDWKAILMAHNKSSYYGCDNRLAVQSIVLSVS